jgi:hypothetical protein
MEAGFAGGSMVLFLSFSQKFGAQSQIFVKKDVQFRPAGGDIRFRGGGRITFNGTELT